MKILFLTTHLNTGGISTYIVTLTKYLKKRDINVICASSGGIFTTELEKNGIKHYAIPSRTKNELHIKLLFSFFKIIEIIDKEEITHIHAHTRISHVLGSLVQKVRKVHLVTTCHGFYKRRILRRLFPAWGDRVIAISDAVREHLVNDFKVNKSKVSLVYNGVEPEKFDVHLSPDDKKELRRYYKIGEDGIVVGGISRLEKIKGYQYLIGSIPAVLEKYPKVKLVLIGDGKYKKKLQKLARKLKVEDNVFFTGKVEDIAVAFELIDVFVHPCIWQEGFGLAVLEAMAARKPVIVSDQGGLYAIVKDGVNGWLLPARDVEALGEAIIKLIDNPELMRSMGEHSRRIAQEKFSMELMTTEMFKVYKELEEE